MPLTVSYYQYTLMCVYCVCLSCAFIGKLTKYDVTWLTYDDTAILGLLNDNSLSMLHFSFHPMVSRQLPPTEHGQNKITSH